MPSSAGRSCRGCCATSPSRDLGRTVSARRCRRRCCCAGRRAVDRPPRGGAGGRAGGALARGWPASSARQPPHDRGGGRGGRLAGSLVSALLAARAGSRGELRRGVLSSAGYEAIVVTLDTWMLGWRPRDLQKAYLPFLKGEGVANYFSDPVFRAALPGPPEEDFEAAIGQWAYQFSNPDDHVGRTWPGCASRQSLPIVLKGINHAEDATRAIAGGVDGLIVSNHGGRQVDGAIGALDALPAVREAVGEGFPVLFDSGVRTGADVFKAIALAPTRSASGGPTSGPRPGRAGRRRTRAALSAGRPRSVAGAERPHEPRPGRARFCDPSRRLSGSPPAAVDTVAGWLLARRARPSD